jgi:hypothetical protein
MRGSAGVLIVPEFAPNVGVCQAAAAAIAAINQGLWPGQAALVGTVPDLKDACIILFSILLAFLLPAE